MHTAIDLRIADRSGAERSGLGRFAVEATRGLLDARPEWRLTIHGNRRELVPRAPASWWRTTRWPTATSAGRVGWTHLGSLASAMERPDVWFGPAYVLPAWWRGAAAVAVHDLSFMLLRERYRGRLNALHAAAATRLAVRRAQRVICGTEHVRGLLADHLSVDPDRVEVVPYGVAAAFTPEGAPRAARRPYLVAVGTWEARKGLGVLLDAARALFAVGADIDLVLAGRRGWGAEGEVAALETLPNVRLVRDPDDGGLAELYRGALALVHASQMEGYGLPIVEAMACGCPVVLATTDPAAHEVAAGAALVAAREGAAVAAAAQRLREDDALRRRHVAAGLAVAAPLDWAQTAERIAITLERAAA